MTINDLVIDNRSYRRFFQEVVVKRSVLEKLVDLARLSASGQNLQPLKYFLSCDPDVNAIIFRHLTWAGYLQGWTGPEEGERPSAYVLILGDKSISTSFGIDSGIAAQSIRLGVTEMGLGSCVVGSIKRKELAESLGLSDRFEILLAISIGKPKETVVLETVRENGDIKYWRDNAGVHHVPKRTLNEVIVNLN
ncbi:MAG: nitroreductase family protein [Desulfobulbaceae bacterium]|nr:nitroreductase family protein [Desulfobulbaceae bacterium]